MATEVEAGEMVRSRNAGSHQKLEEAGPGGSRQTEPLISDFWPPALCRDAFGLFLLIQCVVLYYSINRTPIQDSSMVYAQPFSVRTQNEAQSMVLAGGGGGWG